MASMSKTQIIGYLGSDPEIRSTTSGTNVATMNVAVSEKWKDAQGTWHESTEWFTVVLWKKQADIAAKFLKKGSMVYVEGKMKTRTWEDKNGGGKRSKTELQGSTFLVLDRREDANDGNYGARPARPKNEESEGTDPRFFPGGSDVDDLPF